MAGKMSPKFVALCSLAVGAIYSSGYAITANAASTSSTSHSAYASLPISTTGSSSQSDQGGAAGGSSANNTQANSNDNKSSAAKDTSSASHTTSTAAKPSESTSSKTPSNSKTSSTTKSTSSSSTATTKSTQPTKPVQQLLDGTYNGSASNRIGTIGVAVTINQGKIKDVQITSCDTHYAESYIDPVLPQYVVTNQTTNIPVISGATLSTEDFYYALVQALQQALNPNYKG